MKIELSRKIIIKLVGLRGKSYSYLIDGSSENKKAKHTKRCFIKIKLIKPYKIITKTVYKQLNLRIK